MEPSPSPFDLRWRMFGIDVRVHPTFWLFSMMMGWPLLFPPRQPGFAADEVEAQPWILVTWVLCQFFSILVHELGHVIASRTFGIRADIVLYSFGGLAIGHFNEARRWQRILIALAGPAAGLLLFGAVVLLDRHLFWPHFTLARTEDAFVAAIQFLLFMNLFWSIINLAPVFPLDGGQVLREATTSVSRWNGMRMAFGISFVFGALIAGYSILVSMRNKPGVAEGERLYWPSGLDAEVGSRFSMGISPLFMAIFFGLLAIQCFMWLRQEDE